MEADAAAQDAYSQELFAASTALDSTLVAAVLSYRSTQRAAQLQSTNERMAAYVDALDRWDQLEQTPESALALASARATAAYWTGYVANDNAWYAAQDAHAAEWIGTVAAADATYFSQMSQASSAANGTVLSAIATLALSGADREQSLTTGISSLGSTLNSTLLTNATTWFGTVLSAGESADSQSIANAVGRDMTTSSAAGTFVGQINANYLASVVSQTAAGVAFVNSISSTIIAVGESIAAQMTGTSDSVISSAPSEPTGESQVESFGAGTEASECEEDWRPDNDPYGSFGSGWWYYFWEDPHPVTQVAQGVAVTAGAAAGGLAVASYAGVSQIGVVGLTQIPAQATLEINAALGAAGAAAGTAANSEP
ncbi:MAG: hypothetical protein ACK5Q5_07555, partial [Planctomycetaceae bacterium]